MTITQLLASLTPQQVNEILIADGIESRDTVSNVNHVSGQTYSYEVFDINTHEFIDKKVNVFIDDLNVLTIQQLNSGV